MKNDVLCWTVGWMCRLICMFQSLRSFSSWLGWELFSTPLYNFMLGLQKYKKFLFFSCWIFILSKIWIRKWKIMFKHKWQYGARRICWCYLFHLVDISWFCVLISNSICFLLYPVQFIEVFLSVKAAKELQKEGWKETKIPFKF